jgi:cysteine-rich repeat protein
VPFGCASAEEAASCVAKIDGDSCATSSLPRGACAQGACLPTVCGDGIVVGAEVCDDGNRIDNDGCAANCDSNETCGNGIVDAVSGESCDDGGNRLQSHDGCAANCQVELATWLPANSAVNARDSFAMIEDIERQEIVAFGGSGGPETWIWNGEGWQLRTPTTSPPSLSYTTMAYDSDRKRAVLIGGRQPNGDRNSDIWEWDGVTWEQKSPSSGPSPRAFASSAYDAVRRRVVMFGGTDDTGARNDTWTWDGTSWTEQHPLDSPSNRSASGMAYDGARQEIILFGGVDMNDDALPDMWSWDGATWNRRTPTVKPPRREVMSMVFDRTRNIIVLFGGFNRNGALNDTWQWNGSNWLEINASPTPPARHSHGGGYDSKRGAVVIFGGLSGSQDLSDSFWFDGSAWQATPEQQQNRFYSLSMAYDSHRGRAVVFGGTFRSDTYEWTGVQWLVRTPLVHPPTLTEHASAYDPIRKRVVVFGGRDSAGTNSDQTWEWDGNQWVKRITSTSPTARYGHSMAFDGEQIVLFGGTMTTETWLWNGTRWQPVTTAVSPPWRSNAAFAYDSVRRKLVMYGGYGDGALQDTWEWDSASKTWQDRSLSSAISPGYRTGSAMAYDPTTRRTILYGGTSSLQPPADTWSWDGTAWKKLLPIVAPLAPMLVAMVYDQVRQEMVMVGRFGNNSQNESWRFSFVNPVALPDACGGQDTDRDGALGCDDPDCRGKCFPTCTPGTVCSKTSDACGDSVCNRDLENYLLCPSDCVR